MASPVLEVTKGLRVTLEALPGKADEVERLLREARAIVEAEDGTIAWFAVRLGPTTFGIFDVFFDEAARQAHLSGQVAQALVGLSREPTTGHERVAHARNGIFQSLRRQLGRVAVGPLVVIG